MADSLQPWNEADLPALLTLTQASEGHGHYRNRHGDVNLNGRSFGGQSLGQALMAASMSAPPDREATAMQFMFLQGSVPDQPIDFEVTPLQDGKRFTSRHVRGTQGSRSLFDAQVTFALPLDAPEHQVAIQALESNPDDVPPLPDASLPWESRLKRLGGYSLREKACIDFRVPDMESQVAPDTATLRLRYWLKARHPLPATQGMHAAAFAYMSDWWLNFSSLGSHVRDLDSDRRLYVASLNHCIWFHRPFAADDWLHFDSHSPCAVAGRGLSIGSVHDRHGVLVASVTQDCLMGYA